MKTLFSAAVALLAVSTVNGGVPLSPAEVTAMVAAVAPGQTVRIAPRGDSGFLLYGAGKSGSIVPAGQGWTIYYGGKSHNVLRNGNGWTVYGGR